jgi:hypothetical protein
MKEAKRRHGPRRGEAVGEPAAEPLAGPIRVRGAVLDLNRRIVTYRGRSAELTGRESELLAFLLHHPDEYFTAESLLRLAWRTTHRSPEALRVYVRRLREKIAPLSLPYELTSQQWLGYCLVTTSQTGGLRRAERLLAWISKDGRSASAAPPQSLTAWGGLAGTAGFSLLAVSLVLHLAVGPPAGGQAALPRLLFTLWDLGAFLAVPLALLGWITIYTSQARGAMLTATAGFLLILPVLTIQLPSAGFDQAFASGTLGGNWLSGGPGWTEAERAVGILAASLGYLLTGMAVLRVGAFPPWTGWLLLAGVPAVLVGALTPLWPLTLLGGVLEAVAPAWMCYSIWRRRPAADSGESRRAA